MFLSISFQGLPGPPGTEGAEGKPGTQVPILYHISIPSPENAACVFVCVSAFHVLLSRSVLQQHVLYYSVKYLNIWTHFTNILSLGFRPSVVFYREETRQCTSCTLQLCDCWIQILSSDDGFALKLSKLTPKLRGRCLIIVGLNSRRQSLYSTVVLKEITPCLVC